MAASTHSTSPDLPNEPSTDINAGLMIANANCSLAYGTFLSIALMEYVEIFFSKLDYRKRKWLGLYCYRRRFEESHVLRGRLLLFQTGLWGISVRPGNTADLIILILMEPSPL